MVHPKTFVHLPSNVNVFSFSYQPNLTPTTHAPSREVLHLTVGSVLLLR